MINLDVHGVTKVRPEVRKFGSFSVLYLHLEGPAIPANTRVTLFCDHLDGGHLVNEPGVPMDLLNQLVDDGCL